MPAPSDVFPFIADGANFPDQVTDFSILEIPARSTSSAANLYVQVAGVAHFDVDPFWDDGDGHNWFRGDLAVTMPQQVLKSGDTLVEWTAFAGMQHLERDEEGDTDDFGIALDDVASVHVAQGDIKLALHAAYQGDAWAPKVDFLLDLMIYRPGLDTVAQAPWWSRPEAWARLAAAMLKYVDG
jgi:hypothetical protein